MFKKVILHVGHGKTGSSSIQRCMRLKEEEFKSCGFQVLMPKKRNVHHLLRSAFQNREGESLKIIREGIRRCREFDTLIISSENIVAYSREDLLFMKDFLSSFCSDIHLLLYLRHPYTHSVSLCQTLVKNGQHTLNEFVKNPFVFRARDQIEKLESVFDRHKFKFAIFDSSLLYQGDVVSDFVVNVGIPQQETRQFQVDPINESLSMEAVLFADYVYTHYSVARHNDEFKSFLQRIEGGKFTLPVDVLEKVKIKAKPHLEWLRDNYNIKFPDVSLDMYSGHALPDMRSEFYTEMLVTLNNDLSIKISETDRRVV